MSIDRCMVKVNQDPTSFRGYYVQCGRPVKGSRVYSDAEVRGVCGIHARAKYPPVAYLGRVR